ncbi:MAG: ferredoxin III, nif-specific [Alphaproteobacteria bacterium]
MSTALFTRDGRPATPAYLEAIDAAACIGCGRCFKVCGRGVMRLVGIDEDGALVEIDDEDDDEVERMISVLDDAGACIGCGACARVCAKGAQTHAAA